MPMTSPLFLLEVYPKTFHQLWNPLQEIPRLRSGSVRLIVFDSQKQSLTELNSVLGKNNLRTISPRHGIQISYSNNCFYMLT